MTRAESQTTPADVVVAEPLAFEPGSAPAPPAVEDAKPVGPKKRATKPKPCARCEERRARERQYAKTSRLRARASRNGATDATEPSPSSSDSAPVETQVASAPA